VISGSSITVTLTAKDANNNLITNLTPSNITFNHSTGTSTGTFGGSVNNAGSGTYTNTFTGVTAGTATLIGASISSQALTSSKPGVTVTAGNISLSNSAITASASSVTAGSNITITLTAKDANNNLLSNITTTDITFTLSSGTGVSSGSLGASVTNATNGNYTTTFMGTTAGTATTIGATITGAGAVTASLPTVTVYSGAPSTTTSSLTLSDDHIEADPTVDSAILTVTLKDAYNNPVAGKTVTFSASGPAGYTLTQPTIVTDSSGQTTGTLVSTTIGTVNVNTATVNGSAFVLSSSVPVIFYCVADTTNSTMTASPATLTANGVSTTSITITVKDGSATPVACANVPITFVATGSNNTFTTTTGYTNASGVLTTSLASTKAETKTVYSSTGDLGGLSTAVTFTPGAVAPTYSTISAYPAYGLALGATTTVTVNLKDAYGNPVPSTSTSFTSSIAGDTIGSPGSTNSSGIAKGSLQAPVAGGTIGSRTVSIATPAGLTSVTTTVTYVTSTVVAANSTITGSGPVYNDGVSTSNITVTLKDASNNAVSGMYVAFSASDTGGTNAYSDCGLSNASGIATCTLSSKVAESKTLSLLTPVNITSASPVVFQSNFKLQVPIEILDYGILAAANSAQTDWSRTQISLDTTAYDGTVTYSFEATCTNADSTARTLSLIDSKATANVVSTLTFPAGTTTLTRLSNSFTIPGTYVSPVKLRTPAIGTGGALTCYSARILVNQTNATKTRIYIPLTSGPSSAAAADTTASITNGAIMTAASKSLGQGTNPDYFTLWTKNSAALSILDSTTPWTFEAVAANSAGAKSVVGLATSAGATIGSITSANNTSPTQLTFTIADSAAGFSDGTTVKAVFASTSKTNPTYLYKAGLWAKITALTNAEVQYRVGRYESVTANDTIMESRAAIDTSLFRNPSTYFEVVGRDAASSQMVTGLGTLGANDASATASSIASSSLGFTSTTKAASRTGTLSITNGDRFVPMITGTASGTLVNSCSNVVIQAQ
jgi:adhesin/invasin